MTTRIISLRRLSIKSQLLILLLFVGLSGVALVTFVALRSAKSVREQTLFSQLTSVRASKANRIQGYFSRIRAHIDTLGEDEMILGAMKEFGAAYQQLASQPLTPEMLAALTNFYTQEFLPRLAANSDGRPALESYFPVVPQAQYLQFHYLVQNPNAAAVPGVLADPPPAVTTTSYGDSAINYQVAFAVTNYPARWGARNEFLNRIWYAARRHGLTMPFPIRTVYSHQVDLAAEAATKLERVGKELAALPTLQALPESGLRELSADSVIQHFARNELVLREGDRNAMLYLLLAGEALLSTPDERGMEREVARLSRGDFLGIRQVMLGQPSSTNARALTDLVLVAIPGDAAHRMLDRSPRLARDLGAMQEARRKATLRAKRGGADHFQGDGATDTHQSENTQR
jgi:hypothetical protein